MICKTTLSDWLHYTEEMPAKGAGAKRAAGPAVAGGAHKKSSLTGAGTSSRSDVNAPKSVTGANLAQGDPKMAMRTATSYFDASWNAYAKQQNGSLQWAPEKIVAMGEDFHSQVGNGKVKTILYKVRWKGYDRKDDTWEPITHLQGYGSMCNAFREQPEKEVEKIAVG